MTKLLSIQVGILLIFAINLEINLAKPTESESHRVRRTITNYRCVENFQCQDPITPNPSFANATTLPPDLAVYDGKGDPIWTLSFCKRACNDRYKIPRDAGELNVRSEEDTTEEHGMVCCGEEQLIPEELSKPNWSLTKDPTRCSEFEKDGYICVPESQCKSGGFSKNLDNGNSEKWNCGNEFTAVRGSFEEEEREKSNGNVCCKTTQELSPAVTTKDTTQYCSQLEGFSCVHPEQCYMEEGGGTGEIAELMLDDSDGVLNERSDYSEADYTTSAICENDDSNQGELGISSLRTDDEEKVCCHEENVKPLCSAISDTHSCVAKSHCSPAGRRKSHTINIVGRTDGGIDPTERHCTADTLKASTDKIRTELMKVFDVHEDDYYDLYNSNDGPYEEEEQLVCCDKTEIIPDEPIEILNLNSCPTQHGFKCIPQALCRNSQIVITISEEHRDAGIIQTGVRINNDNQTVLGQEGNVCGSVLEVCCNTKNVPKLPDRMDHLPPENYKSKCGTHNAKGIEVEIIDGKEDRDRVTQFGEWPNMCAISKVNVRTGKYSTYLGGASLITAGIVLTAAHKVAELTPGDISVRCGDWDVKTKIEPRPHQVRKVDSISIHPAFDSVSVYNDVALLHVKEEFKLDKHIDRICIPPPNDRFSYASRGCRATGWGKDKFEGGNYQVRMAQVNVPLVDNRKCESNLRRYTALSNSFKLHDSFMCAGGEKDGDVCTGDGGGPLMCPSADDPNQWIQAGLTAWGIGCGKEHVPGVYASIADATCFIDWATKCKHGNKYSEDYDFKECHNDAAPKWIDDEIARLEENLHTYAFHLEKSDLPPVQRKRYEKKSRTVENYIEKAKELRLSCHDERKQDIFAPIPRAGGIEDNDGLDQRQDANGNEADYDEDYDGTDYVGVRSDD